MYKLCVFDLDGTLVNTIADIAFAVNRALEELELPVHEEDAYRLMVGNGMQMLCVRALPEDRRDDEELLSDLVRRYNDYYCAHCCDRSRAYPGIPDMLRRLNGAGIRCAVISNKPHPQTRIVLETLFDTDDFFYAEGQSERFAKKPDAEALLDCIAQAGVSKDETIYVGDSNVDAAFAKNAGVNCIGATWGFRGRKELEEAGVTYLAETAEDICRIVLKQD